MFCNVAGFYYLYTVKIKATKPRHYDNKGNNKKNEKIAPFGGIFAMMEAFDRQLSRVIDGELGLRSTLVGYQYSEIFRSLMCSDTILRGIEEFSCANITYVSETGKSYDFNTADRLNGIEVELNSMYVEKWEGKACRLVIERLRRNVPTIAMERQGER